MISTPQRGLPFTRAVKSLAIAGPGGDPTAYASTNYGDQCALLAKALVSAVSIANTPEHSEFWGMVVQQAILGKLQGLRIVPLDTRTVSVTSGATGYWVGAGNPKPLSKIDFLGSSLSALKIACLIVFTQELLRSALPEAEARFREDLTRVLVEELDRSFIDVGNSGVPGEQPASVTSGATPIASTGNPAADIAALIESFTGDLSVAAFISDPITAAGIALSRDAAGSFQFPDASPRGGSILGMPLIVSRSSPHATAGGQLALLDPSGIAYASAGVKVALSGQTSLSMRDDPTSPIEQVSLFQTNSAALLAEINANWEVQRVGSVSVIVDASYPVAVS